MNIVAITQARMSSTRLPGKVLKKINDKSLVEIHFQRVSKSTLISKHVLATSNMVQDDELEKFALKNNIIVFRGDENNVLKRFVDCLTTLEKVDYVVRLTADCPLIDAEVIDECIKLIIEKKVDYVSNSVEPTFPDGMDVEVFTYESLIKVYNEAVLNSDKEHVTPYIWRNSNIKNADMFKAITFKNKKDFSNVRLTVDEQVDFDLIKLLIEKYGINEPWHTYANYVLNTTTVINQTITRNEGYIKSLKKD